MCTSFLSFTDFAANMEEEQLQRKSKDDLVQVRGKHLIQQSANICARWPAGLEPSAELSIISA